jgi:hypothetical protein
MGSVGHLGIRIQELDTQVKKLAIIRDDADKMLRRA